MIGSILFDGLFQLLVELGVEVGGRSIRGPFERRENAHPFFAGAGMLLFGGIAGLLLTLVFRRRFFPVSPLPGASLVLSPLLNGVVMEYYGRWRERRTGTRSYLATFWGGALFALGMASVRFLMTQR